MSVFWRLAFSSAFALLLIIKFQEVSGIRVCGTRLADTLALACSDRGGFHTPVRRSTKAHVLLKRDIVYLMKTKTRPNQILPNTDVVASEPIERRSFGNHLFNIPGVVDECCRRSCSYTTLISYCASTSYSTTTPTVFTDFIKEVGYHSKEETSKENQAKESEETVNENGDTLQSSDEVQSDQPETNNSEMRNQLEGKSENLRHESLTAPELGRVGHGQQFGRRPNLGVFSRNKPFFFVVSSRFNGQSDYPVS